MKSIVVSSLLSLGLLASAQAIIEGTRSLLILLAASNQAGTSSKPATAPHH